MKNFKYLLFIAIISFFLPMYVEAVTEKPLTCKQYVKLNGTSIFYGPDGQVMGSEQEFIAACQQSCIVTEKVSPEYNQTPAYASIPYCNYPEEGYNYYTRGCFAGAFLDGLAAYGSEAWFNPTAEELMEIVQKYPNLVYLDPNTGMYYVQVKEMFGQNPETKVAYFTKNVCKVLNRDKSYNRGGTLHNDVKLSYSAYINSGGIQKQVGADLTRISGTLSAINAALDSGNGVVVSIVNDGTFTHTTHYISIIARNGDQYLVVHSGTVDVSPSGWYGADVIQKTLRHINAGIWSFIPDNCYERVYELPGKDSCTCDPATGMYTYTKYDSNGNVIATDTWAENSPEHKEKLELYKTCPATCSSDNSCKVIDGTYYGVAGNAVTPLEFYDECCESGILSGEEYDLYCPCGDPDINFIGNCSEFNTAEQIVNTVKDTEESARLKTCLFNLASTDAASNTVRMGDQDIVLNNRYCKVGCVEEYEFTLPTAKYTTSGGYFSLSSSVSGKRTCYVNAQREGNFDGIDYEQFIEDLYALNEKLVNAYNEWNKLNTAIEKYKIKKDEITGKSYESYDTTCYHSDANRTPYSCQKCQEDTGNGCNTDQWYNISYNYRSYTVKKPTQAAIDAREAVIELEPGTSSVEEKKWTDGAITDGSSEDGSCSSCSTDEEGSEQGLLAKIEAGDGAGSRTELAALIEAYKLQIEETINAYNACSTWENLMKFDPVIEFDYDEPYMGMGGFNNKFEQSSLSSSKSNKFCTMINDQYVCTAGVSGTPINYGQKYATCTTKDEGCEEKTTIIYNSPYASKEANYSAVYQPKNNFSTYTPIGTIVLDKESGLYTVLCNEQNCLPVSLNQVTGVFNYRFKFSNIGQYNDTDENGRLMGGENSVFDAVELDAGYVCQYINNCPECDYTCVGESCDIDPDPSCPDCPVVCDNCIFDGKEQTFYYRTVSINNLFPNNREYGPNWDNDKGSYTKRIIQEEGDEVYGEAEYSYTINANQMKRIRQFNASVTGYLNTQMPNGDDALTCHSLSSNGATYQNIYCISSFLNTAGNVYFTQNKRNDRWTLWPDSGYYSSSTSYSVRDGLGPSWK